jgi:hypothetical protein
MTNESNQHPQDNVILGELYWRFVQGTVDWRSSEWNRPDMIPIGKGNRRRFRVIKRGERKDLQPLDIRDRLTVCYDMAKFLWLPDELAKRKAALEQQHLIGPARQLATVRPDMTLARFLFDHPDSLSSFVDPGSDLDATPYDLLVWFHFELYPSLRESFLAGEFPAVQDLPSTVLGIAPVKPTAESAQGQPGKVLAAGTTQVEAMDKGTTAGRKPIFGETWNVHGIPIYWGNVVSRFRSLSRWRKLIAIVVAILILAFFSCLRWLPLVHPHVGTRNMELQRESLRSEPNQ